MSVKIIRKVDFPQWVEKLDNSHHLMGPKSVNNHYVFDDFHSAEEIDLGYSTSVLPPKKALLPQSEVLLKFDLKNDSSEVIKTKKSTIVMGVHTCDMHSIILLDEVFLQGYRDQHYQAHRENTTFVTIECLEPCSEHAFCKDMGTLSIPEQFDLHLTDLGEAYAIDIGSTKGAALLEGLEVFQEPDNADYKLLSRVMSNKWARFPYKLDTDITDLPSLMKVSQKSALWNELGERCLSCGLCTLVCPTCYCFDVHDEIDLALSEGIRFRIWDSCQLDQFAEVAGGHDFRAGRANRQRHRFMRKYNYQSISAGLLGCVGCGRCAQACTVDISPVKVLNRLHHRRVAATLQEAMLR
jgi:ferredoxin